jgi:hypothetical protein
VQVLLAHLGEDKAAHSKARELLNVWIFRRNPLDEDQIEQLKGVASQQRKEMNLKTTGDVVTLPDGKKMVVMECVPHKVIM